MQYAGFDGSDKEAILFALPITLSKLLGSAVGVGTVDTFGRRGVLLKTLPVVIVALSAAGIMFIFAGNEVTHWLVFAGILIYVFFFTIGLAPVPWILINELIPLSLRSTAGSVATCANLLANFAVSFAFLPIISTKPGLIAIWFVFALFALIAIIWTVYRVPETKGMKLEETSKLKQN